MQKAMLRGISAVAVCLIAGLAVWLSTAGSQEVDSRFAPLIEQLGHEDFAQREAASEQLAALGDAALAALRQTAESHADLETRLRAQQLVTKILLAGRTSKSIGLEMSLVPAGTMMLGSPDGESGRKADEKLHRVQMTRSFLLGTYEVTQEEWARVMRTVPSWFGPEGPGKDKVPDGAFNRHPVERVTWYDAIEFCNKLSAMDGFQPYYKLADVVREGASIKAAKVTIAGGSGYRLPTEAEWEYACRSGTTTPFHFGAGSNGQKANVKGMTFTGYGGTVRGPDLQRTAPVGNYEPNPWGLCDMHGNVAEWCWDWYRGEYYGEGPERDPAGPETGHQRVARGGSWMLNETSSRSAARGLQTPDESKEHTGFRVARTP
jgi:formylglycine-generating enzyme required for sulfatase activity